MYVLFVFHNVAHRACCISSERFTTEGASSCRCAGLRSSPRLPSCIGEPLHKTHPNTVFSGVFCPLEVLVVFFMSAWSRFRHSLTCRPFSHKSQNTDTLPVNMVQGYCANGARAALGIEPRTSRTQSENHTTGPSSPLLV